MASRRTLKKNVNYVFGELFMETLVNHLYVPGTDKVKADKLMERILREQSDFVSRISHTEPGNVKGYYKKYRDDFNKMVNEIVDEINSLKA